MPSFFLYLVCVKALLGSASAHRCLCPASPSTRYRFPDELVALLAGAMASQQTRDAVTGAADSLQLRPATRQLDESLGAKDWKRLRTEWLTEARACGPGWEMALTYMGNIAGAPVYTPAMMFLNDDNGAPPPSLKHIMQGALLAWIRRALPVSSESYRIIKDCVHAGGCLGPEAVGAPPGQLQALMLLDQRWSDPVATEKPVDKADALFGRASSWTS